MSGEEGTLSLAVSASRAALEGGAINVGDPVEVVSLGDGTCAYTPPEALAELAAATR